MLVDRSSANEPGLPSALSGGSGLMSDRLVRQIERLIVEGGLRVGDRLPSERELTRTYSVSRSVVRDAIASLEQQGLVRAQAGSGIFVEDASQNALAQVLAGMVRRQTISLLEVLEVRTIIEVQNAALAAERWTDAALTTAEQGIRDMENAKTPGSFVEGDLRFHEGIAAAAGNRVAMAILASLRSLLLEGMLIGTAVDGARQAAIEDHRAVFQAVEARDAARAADLMAAHQRRGYDEWIEAGYVGRDGNVDALWRASDRSSR